MFTIRNQSMSQKSDYSLETKHLKTITCDTSFVVLVNKYKKQRR